MKHPLLYARNKYLLSFLNTNQNLSINFEVTNLSKICTRIYKNHPLYTSSITFTKPNHLLPAPLRISPREQNKSQHRQQPCSHSVNLSLRRRVHREGRVRVVRHHRLLLLGVPHHARRLRVLVQVRLERERLVALRTAEVFVARVRLHVRPQVRPVRESLAAVGAAVGLLAGVRPQVALQQPRPRELRTADAATVRQLVREQVHGQGRHADVGLAARHALLRRLGVQAAVGLLVARQVAGGGVLPPALAARVAAGLRRVRGVGELLLGDVVGVVFDDFVELLKGRR